MNSNHLRIVMSTCWLLSALFLLSQANATTPTSEPVAKKFECISNYVTLKLKLCGFKSVTGGPFWISCRSTIPFDNDDESAKRFPWVVVAGVISPQATDPSKPECNETTAYFIANTIDAIPLRIRFDEKYEKEIVGNLLEQKSPDSAKPAFDLKASSNTHACTVAFRKWLDNLKKLVEDCPHRNDAIGCRLRKHASAGMGMMFMQKNATDGWVAVDSSPWRPFYCHDFSAKFQDVPDKLSDCEYLAVGKRGVVVCQTIGTAKKIVVKTSVGPSLSVPLKDCFQYFQTENKFLSVKTSFSNETDETFVEALCKGLAEDDLWKPIFRQDPMIYVQLYGE